MLVAKGLQHRGYRVVVVVCASGLTACESRSEKISGSKIACRACGVNLKIIESFGFEIYTIASVNLSEFKMLAEDNLAPGYANALADSVNRHFYGDIPSDVSVLNEVRRRYLATLSKIEFAAADVFKQYQPTILLAYMMVYVENYPWIAHASANKIRVAHISNTQFNENAQTLNFWDLYKSNERYGGFLAARGERNSMEESGELDSYLKRRFSGKLLSEKLNLSRPPTLEKKILKAYPFLAEDGRTSVILFPNVLWDSGMSTQNTAFAGIEEWLEETVAFLSAQKEFKVVIKCHPQERLYTAKGRSSKDVILGHFNSELPENVNIIDHCADISSYDLFPFMDICCVYNGTIGLEALLCEKHVVVGGRAPYSRLTVSRTVKERGQYFQIFEEYDRDAPPVSDSEAVRRFAFFYFLKSPIPWALTKKSVGASYYESLVSFDINRDVEKEDHHFKHLLNCIEDPSLVPEVW